MKGWMKYKQKGGLVGRLTGLRSENHLWFVLKDGCKLVGYKDETAAALEKAEISFDVGDSAITISQENSNQFEVVGERQHLLFTVDVANNTLSWVSSLQHQRNLKQNISTSQNRFQPPEISEVHQDVINSKPPANSVKFFNKPESENVNGQLVFDDPLSALATSSENVEFEWDNEAASEAEPPVWSPTEDTTSSAVFQLSQELTFAKEDLKKCRQRIQSYQEVLASRDRQLFQIQDEMLSKNHNEVHTEAYKNLEEQARSYRGQNALLNEEVLKLHEMYNKKNTEAEKHRCRADKLSNELLRFQRDYVAAISACVHRPLVDPDEGASFNIAEHDRHIATLKTLTRSLKAKKDRILGCSIPALGRSEHIDTFGFIHSLPNEALQVQYLCRHLQEAFDLLLETDDDSQKNLKKWKSCILDTAEEFEVTPHLRKLVLQGIPNQYRAYVWQKMIYYYVSDMRRSCGEDYFEQLLGHFETLKEDKNYTKNFKQIAMDVPRTMPNNKDFIVADSPHKERLQRVLTAFCIHSPKVEYCQGFNFLAGGCLLFLEEEDAFWFLVAVTEKVFPPDYYRNGLSGLLADQYVLRDIVLDSLPRFHDHLCRYPEVDLAAVTTGWFLGLFFDCLPFQTLIHVWDCFLAFGHEAVFRVSLAMFKLFERQLLELNEFSQILHAVKNIPRLCLHPGELIKEAFSGPFPPWEDIEEQRCQIEEELVATHEKKMQQRRYYDEKLMKLDQYDEGFLRGGGEEKWSFDRGAASHSRVILSANCGLTQNSQLYEVSTDFMKTLGLQITNRIMCVYVVTDDVILTGSLTGQLQCHSVSESCLRWSMSLSDIVLCILTYDNTICAGTADGKLHFLQMNDEGIDDGPCARKPSLTDSIELSKRPTTCMCLVAKQSTIWVASGPAIYVVSTETNETDGFFLISSKIDLVSSILHWSSYILIAVRGSSVLQLHSTQSCSSPPLLVYDISKEKTLTPLYPMMPDENEARSPPSDRVTCLLSMEDDKFWVGTACGEVKMYQLQAKEVSKSADVVNVAEDSQPDDLEENSLSLRLLGSKRGADKAIRSLLKSDFYVVSCAGCYGDEGAVKIWDFSGEFTNLEVPVSECSGSELLDENRSLTSSSRSLDVDQRPVRSDGTLDTWKSMMKSAASTTMRTYRDNKPRLRRFMNMLGSNQN